MKNKTELAKVHMESAIDRDDVCGKTRTLCGLHLTNRNVLVKNPDGVREVTCKKCIQIIENDGARRL